MTKKKPSRGRYLRIEDAIYLSEAFRTLPPSALKLWIDMRTQLNGYNNGRIDATKKTLAGRGWTSPETIYRALNELLDRGLLVCTRKGKPGPARICSLFRFTDLATEKDEKRFVEGGRATFDFMHWEKKFRGTETVSVVVRKSNRYRYGNRTVDDSTATEIEPRKNDETGPQATPVANLRESTSNSLNGTEIEPPYSYQGIAPSLVGTVLDPALPDSLRDSGSKTPGGSEFDNARQRAATGKARCDCATAKAEKSAPKHDDAEHSNQMERERQRQLTEVARLTSAKR